MISVIVPGYNVAATIEACLGSLLNQTVPRESYEVIFVDDGSTDGTSNIVKRYQDVRLLMLSSNRGQATARNLGLQEAKGEFILFTDADCIPAPDWIEAMLKPFSNPEIVGSKGVYRTQQKGLVPRFAQIEYESRYDIMKQRLYIDFIDTYSAGYQRSVLEQIGGFDARFRVDEDQELSFRLARGGYKMVFNPKAVVYHQHPATLRRYLKRKYQIGYWKAFVLRRHPQKAIEDSHTPQSLKAELAWALLALLGAVFAPIYPPLLLASALALALFLVTALPFTRKALRRDFPVGLISPFMLFLRALALGLGLVVGLVSAWRQAI